MAFSIKFLAVLLLGLVLISSGGNCKNIQETDYAEKGLEFLSAASNQKGAPLSSGEWLIAYLKTSIPVCNILDPIFEKLAADKDFADLKFAKIFLFPFEIDDYPLIFHIKNGQVRKYEGQYEYDQLVDYIKKDGWSQTKPSYKAEERTSLSDNLFDDFLSLTRGILFLAVIIFMFAWVIDLTSCHKDRRRNFQELTEQPEEDNTDLEVPDELVDEALEKTNAETIHLKNIEAECTEVTDLIDISDFKETEEVIAVTDSTEEASHIPSNEKTINQPMETVDFTSSIIEAKPKKLNPFDSSNESLTNFTSDFSEVGKISESIVVQPFEQTASQEASIQATKFEKSLISDWSTKTSASANSGNIRTPKHMRPKVVKFIENKAETTEAQQDASSSEEQNVLVPAFPDKSHPELSNDATLSEKNYSNESKC